MNCNQVKENLFDAMEPGTPEATHVQSCAQCAAEMKQLEETMALMDEWKVPEPSTYFNTRLRARLAEVRREEAAPQGFWSWLRSPALLRPALVAAMGLAFVVGMNFYQPKPNDKANPVVAAKGTAVADLQALDKNEDLYADFDLLDDVGVNHAQKATSGSTLESQL